MLRALIMFRKHILMNSLKLLLKSHIKIIPDVWYSTSGYL